MRWRNCRKQRDVTVILITHYMEEVIDADQVFVMDDGHIVMHGTPAGDLQPGGRAEAVPDGCAPGYACWQRN